MAATVRSAPGTLSARVINMLLAQANSQFSFLISRSGGVLPLTNGTAGSSLGGTIGVITDSHGQAIGVFL